MFVHIHASLCTYKKSVWGTGGRGFESRRSDQSIQVLIVFPGLLIFPENGSGKLRGSTPIVLQITIYVVLVWFLWRFFMAIGWVLGTWIMNQILGGIWRSAPPRRSL